MSVFSIFCHGTNSHREDNDGEVIGELGRAMKPSEYLETFLILDGPGSKPKSSTSEHLMPGTFDWDPETLEKKPTAKGFFEGKATTLGGVMLGTGWETNVEYAVAVIKKLKAVPAKCNMVGWSRGAITAIKAANRFKTEFPKMVCNIFAIDPVAGEGNKADKDCKRLGSNVADFCATLQMHEQRRVLEPQDVNRIVLCDTKELKTDGGKAIDVDVASTARAMFLPFPGVHDSTVYQDAGKPGLIDAAYLTWHLAWKFMTGHGTKFAAEPKKGKVLKDLKAADICDHYASVRIQMKEYRELRDRWFKWASVKTGHPFMGGINPRDMMEDFGEGWTEMDSYVIDSDYFVNHHHVACFQKAYPNVYKLLWESSYDFKAGKKDASTPKDDVVFKEFKAMASDSPIALDSLVVFDVCEPGKVPKMKADGPIFANGLLQKEAAPNGARFVIPMPGRGHLRGPDGKLIRGAGGAERLKCFNWLDEMELMP